MYLRENPVLQRELLINLRTVRAFVLLFGYLALLGAIVYVAWPSGRIDMTNTQDAKQLMATFFVGQYVLASLLAPSFAAGSLTGEKERQTYEMLLASPLRPTAIVLGKLLASLAHLGILIFASLPIVMLCLPLGGTSPYELLLAYLTLLLSMLTFGMISLAASSFFRRTASALVVSYLIVLPITIVGGLVGWRFMNAALSQESLIAAGMFLAGMSLMVCAPLFAATARRLLHPPDVGAEGKDVIDEERELRESVGLVIQRDKFPDRLFAPPKRTDYLPDGANPMLDKELRSELFSQGTLMLRVVIQVGMFLAIPLMGWLLYVYPFESPWYISYVIAFNMLVGPVFSAGSVTSERERQTLDLLLTTTLTPAQILAGKLISGLRVSSVLTAFILWPLALAAAMVPAFWSNWRALVCYTAIVLVTCLTTATLALFCSVYFKKSAISLMTCYLVIIVLFAGPVAARTLVDNFVESPAIGELAKAASMTSPFAAAFAVPLAVDSEDTRPRVRDGDWVIYGGFIIFYLCANTLMLASMGWLFNRRWRVAY